MSVRPSNEKQGPCRQGLVVGSAYLIAEDRVFASERTLVAHVVDSAFINGFVLSRFVTKKWNWAAYFKMAMLKPNWYLLTFSRPEDKIRTMSEGCLSVDDFFVVLYNPHASTPVGSVGIRTSAVWMQVVGVPNKIMKKQVIRQICSLVGYVIEVDESLNSHSNKAVPRVKVLLLLDNPLISRCYIRNSLVPREEVWVAFKYERVVKICMCCGRIGHNIAECRCSVIEAENDYRTMIDLHWMWRPSICYKLDKRAPLFSTQLRAIPELVKN